MTWVASFFSGAMGLDIGLEQAGLNIGMAQELNPKAVETIRLNGHQIVPGDLRSLLESDPRLDSMRPVDGSNPFAVVGGPPCQPFSTAGKRMGLDDERGGLVLDYLRAVGILSPTYVVIENVRGLASTPGLMDDIEHRLADMGYGCSWGVLNAADFGAPQKRERVIILGRLGHKPVMPEPTHTPEQWVTVAEALEGLEPGGPCASFSAPVTEALALVPDGGNWRDLPADMAQKMMGGAWTSSGGRTGYMRRVNSRRPAPTLVTSPTHRSTLLAHPTESRPLSVREYARLQGFPDDWTFFGSVADQYRQIGNAVPTQLGRAIGRAIMNQTCTTAS